MTAVQELTQITQPWASIFNNSRALSSGVMFAHLSGLVLGGGGAVAADRASLRAVRASESQRQSHLSELGLVHRVVLWGLSVTFLSGLMLAAADVETYATLPAFWIKMGLIGLLLANGLFMQHAERVLSAGTPAWRRLHVTAVVSLVLWFAVLLASTFLTSAG
jgi:uncharacterized membrane-anchored protein